VGVEDRADVSQALAGDGENAEFFNVYGVVNDEGVRLVEAITDVPTRSLIDALPVAEQLASLSGLPLEECRFLFPQTGPKGGEG